MCRGWGVRVLDGRRDHHRVLCAPEQQSEVAAYVAAAKNASDFERQDAAREKTGVFTGSYALNPVNGERLPIWVADYVLMSYGTGAIMAVPDDQLPLTNNF